MKSFPQLSALSSGVSTLFMKFTVFPGILWLRGCSCGWRSSKQGMSPNLHEDASAAGGKPRVNCLELRPPLPRVEILVTTIEILIPWDLSILRSVEIVGANPYGVNEIYGLSHGLGQCGLLLFSQGELKAAVLRPFKKEVYVTPSSRSGISTTS